MGTGTAKKRFFFISLAFAFIIFALTLYLLKDKSSSPQLSNIFHSQVDFNTEIRPIINNKCISCHGGVKRNGGFSLLFRTDALQKAESGKLAIIPGNPDESEMIKRILHHDPKKRMPINGPKLSDDEISKLKTWIAQGAKWDNHWAYVKPQKITPPSTSSSWPINSIDNFVLDRLDKEGLKPSPEADRHKLIRRVSLDLTGLPPTPAEVDAFVNDKSDNAYEKVVDRLLASPRYGERWTAMWLDLARYADSKGYEKDDKRDIWPYRDWVIKAFNKDLPFDQFTTEQLAGDLLPKPNEEQLLATAFHRNTLTNDEGGTDNEEFRTAAVIDRVNTTWEVWQGTTISCVQCHSHPYDPFRNEEYYKFLSFFNNSSDADIESEFPTMAIFHLTNEDKMNRLINYIVEKENLPAFSKEETVIQKRKKILSRYRKEGGECDEVKGAMIKADNTIGYTMNNAYIKFKNMDLSDVTNMSYIYSCGTPEGGGSVELRLDDLNGTLINTTKLSPTEGWATYEKRTFSLTPIKGNHSLYFVFRAKDSRQGLFDIKSIYFHHKNENKGILNAVESLDSMGTDFTQVPIMTELSPEASRKTYIFERGNWMSKGKQVSSDVPASMNPMPKGAPMNRLGVAQWLTSPENPLTGRVIVNRFWEQLFGLGLVETLEDFGTQGAKPSHPELLDWLALDFMNEKKWSVKKLLKGIVMSATYRQSSKVTPELIEKDPRNILLARGPRFRLSAEQIRDQALAIGGLLSPKMYGPSVMPHQPPGIWMTVYSDLKWKLSEGEDKNRRGIYTFWRRSAPYPSSVTFDAPSKEFCVSRRIRTNTPLQALVTLNDTVYLEAARGLAFRMNKEAKGNLDTKIKYAYKLAVAHEPNATALEALNKLYKNSIDYYKKHPDEVQPMAGFEGGNSTEMAALTMVSNIVLNLDELIMKD